MELFGKIVMGFAKKAPSFMFDWVLKTPLYYLHLKLLINHKSTFPVMTHTNKLVTEGLSGWLLQQ